MTARLADAADDAALGEHLTHHFLPGAIRLRATSDPSFLAALALIGRQRQTIIGEEEGRIVATATRSLFPARDGIDEIPLGRLTHLLIAPSHRGWLLARGFAYLRRLHADGAAACYLTTVMEENVAALTALTSRRAGLPIYADLGGVITRIISTRVRLASNTGVMVRRATVDDLPAIIELLIAISRTRSAVPSYTAEELRDGSGLLTGLGLERMMLAWRDGRLVGCLGLWDQRALRQQQIVGYAPWLIALRPLWNLAAPWMRWPSLPAVGTSTSFAFVALPLVRDDDLGVFAALLTAQHREAVTLGLAGMIIALHVRDPLNRVLSSVPAWSLRSRLFAVHWEDGLPLAQRLAQRIPYLETGAL